MKRNWMILCVLLMSATTVLRAEYSVNDLKQDVCQILPQIPGWCSQEKAMHFIDLVMKVQPQVCVEIGVFGGSSAFPVASALKFLGAGVLIAIDPWDKFEAIRYFDVQEQQDHLVWWGAVNLDAIYSDYRKLFKQFSLEEYCVTIRATSESAAYRVRDIDILYLDGSISEEVTARDVSLYLPKVRSGGYIWINDSLGVNKQMALDLLLEECEPLQVIDNGNCVLFRKK